MRHLARFTAMAGVALAAACGGNSSPTGTTPPPPPPPSGSVTTVTIKDFAFSPAAVTIKAGTSVQWANAGPSAHTTTSDAGVWGSATLSAPSGGGGGSTGGTFSFTFMQPGTFPYHCSIHPPSLYPGFTGTITVTP